MKLDIHQTAGLVRYAHPPGTTRALGRSASRGYLWPFRVFPYAIQGSPDCLSQSPCLCS